MQIQTHAKDLDEYFRLMRRNFSASEWDFIRSVTSDRDRLSRFMRLWSLKESYVKAEGFGISVDLEKISFSCPTASLDMNTLTSNTRLAVDGNQLTDWTFEETLIDQDHCVAVALNRSPSDGRSDGDQPVFREVTANELIQGLSPLTDVSESDLVHNWDDYCSKSERPGS